MERWPGPLFGVFRQRDATGGWLPQQDRRYRHYRRRKDVQSKNGRTGSMSRINSVLSLAIALLAVSDFSTAAVNYAVGTCKPSLASYSTISAALAAVPAGATVLVCPGTYAEQVVITQAVTLQGVSNGDSDQAV